MSRSRRSRSAPAVTAAIILLAGCGLDRGSSSGPRATEAPRHATAASQRPTEPSQSVGSSCAPQGGTCLGDLAAGRHTTTTFRPPITYAVPAGWSNAIDQPRNFLIARGADPVLEFFGGNDINVHSNVAAAAQNCDESAEPGTGRSAKDLTRWLASRPGVTSTAPRPVTVGGWPGFSVDLRLAATWKKTCPFADDPVVMLTVGGDPAEFHRNRTFLAKGVSLRLSILDTPDGGNVAIFVVDVPQGIKFEDYLSVAEPIVNSMRFGA